MYLENINSPQDVKKLDFAQLEVLMHHADAQCVGIVRVVDLDLLSVFPYRTLLRLIQTEQHTHQGGFTGAVFAQQGVDLTLAQL